MIKKKKKNGDTTFLFQIDYQILFSNYIIHVANCETICHLSENRLGLCLHYIVSYGFEVSFGSVKPGIFNKINISDYALLGLNPVMKAFRQKRQTLLNI